MATSISFIDKRKPMMRFARALFFATIVFLVFGKPLFASTMTVGQGEGLISTPITGYHIHPNNTLPELMSSHPVRVMECCQNDSLPIQATPSFLVNFKSVFGGVEMGHMEPRSLVPLHLVREEIPPGSKILALLVSQKE